MSSPPPPPPNRSSAAPTFSTHPVHKTLASAANLANLLPTGTVLAFRTLAPSFSNRGTCRLSNQCLTAALIVFCSVICFLSSFTDSFVDSDGKLYYGIATFTGLHILNRDDRDQGRIINREESGNEEEDISTNSGAPDLSRFRISLIDFVHAFVSLVVFMVFALCDGDLQKCLFPAGGEDLDVLVMNLPLAAGVLSSFLFMIFPTTRRGIGCSDVQSAYKFK